jgi:hypothetical protein
MYSQQRSWSTAAGGSPVLKMIQVPSAVSHACNPSYLG